jgi:hypothetical protein
MVRRDSGLVTGGRKDSSFSEEKEAKRLFSLARVPGGQNACQSEKFFGSFFQKRTACLLQCPM